MIIEIVVYSICLIICIIHLFTNGGGNAFLYFSLAGFYVHLINHSIKDGI